MKDELLIYRCCAHMDITQLARAYLLRRECKVDISYFLLIRVPDLEGYDTRRSVYGVSIQFNCHHKNQGQLKLSSVEYYYPAGLHGCSG